MNKKNILKKIKYLLRFLPDKLYLQIYYFTHFHRLINFKNPVTFNEKLNWLKINDRNPEYTKMVDKYEAKKYVANIIGEEYIIPTLGVWDKFDDIDFKKLPNQFVLKCTHDSGSLFIIKDKNKLDKNNIRKELNKSLKYNFYYIGREYPYKNVKPKIIAEEYLEDNYYHELIDYKVLCCNGKAKLLFTCSERFSDEKLKVTFFDLNWKKLPFERKYKSSTKELKQPKNYKKMISLSEKLAKNMKFVRVDWYEINGKLYFGELTFYPGSGFEKFSSKE